ncbi:MAG: extracellular solute-binding protein [Cellvibrionales bacterium]|nr:extracellular solute-binding protein [Cellvibrionales bacterium]
MPRPNPFCHLALPRLALTALLLTGLTTACSRPDPETAADSAPPPVRVYSSRAEHLIKPLFDRYTRETGVPVRYLTDQAAPLIARLAAEGANTAADALLTVDAGNLWHAAHQGLLQSLDSAILDANVPAHWRAADRSWVGLSVRARAIVYSTERVAPAELSTYADLAADRWQGRLCLRTSKKVYNRSLVASMIAADGVAATEAVVRGWVANLATPPLSNDTRAMQAVLAGVCDLTVVNSYYFGRLLQENPDALLAIFWPNQGGRGVHVNVSGMGVTRHARNPAGAQALLEWLSSPAAQRDFAGLNKEYPVNPATRPVATVAAWGEFAMDPIPVERLGELQAEAVRLIDRAGYR